MSALSIQPTYPIFTDIDGQPLEDGYVWIGVANLAPIVNPITVYWDAALTIPAVQPIRTRGGYPINSGTPARLYVNSNYSIQVQNKNGSVVYSAPSATERYSDVVVSGVNAEEVVYDPPFTGAAQTNVEAKLSQTVSVKDFGAVGDGVTDDTAAIQAAIDALPNNNAALIFPAGVYKISSQITIDGFRDSSFTFEGSLLTNATQTGVQLSNLNRCTITGVDVGRSTYNWSSGSGIYVTGYFLNSILQIRKIFGFKYGFHIYASVGTGGETGVAWDEITLGEIRDNQYGIYVSEADAIGYCNAISWHGGNVRLSPAVRTAESATDSWGMVFETPVNFVWQDHRFNGTAFEILVNGIKLRGFYNAYLGIRSEAHLNQYLDAAAGAALTISPGAGPFEVAKYTIATNCRAVTILNAGAVSGSDYRSLAFDDRYGGITFAGLNSFANTFNLFSDTASALGLRYTNYLNATQNFNKQYQASAAPTSGTYLGNSVVWNTNVASGQTMGWVATRSGTLGTLSGVTGNMTIGTPTLTVNDATNLKIGQFIVVAGAVAIGQITNIVGTTVTLDANATATVSGAAVTYYTTFWQAMPVYP